MSSRSACSSAVAPRLRADCRARLLALCAVAAAEAAQSPQEHVRPLDDATPAQPPETPDELSAKALSVAEASADEQAELETIAARHFVLSYPQALAAPLLTGRPMARPPASIGSQRPHRTLRHRTRRRARGPGPSRPGRGHLHDRHALRVPRQPRRPAGRPVRVPA